MTHFFTLFKVQMRINLSLSALYGAESVTGKKRGGSRIAILILLGFSFLTLLSYYVITLNLMADAFLTVGGSAAFLTLVFAAVAVITLVFGLFSVMGNLFFSKDTAFLSSLPIKSRTVFSSKLASTLAGELLISLPFTVPAVIILGLKTSQGLWFYLRCIPVALAIPLLPVTVSALISLILMRVTVIFRRKDLFAIIGGFAFFIFIFYFMQRLNGFIAATELSPELIYEQSAALATAVGAVYPPAAWAGIAAADGSLLYMLLFLAVSIAALAVAVFAASFGYQKSLSLSGEAAKSTPRSGAAKRAVSMRRTSAVTAVAKKELALALRTPIYALNGLTSVIIMPLMIVAMSAAGNISKDMLAELISGLGGSEAFVILILAAILCLVSGIHPLASTTFSREGTSYSFLLSLPVTMKTIARGKLLSSVGVSFAAIIVSAVSIGIFVPISPLLLTAAGLLAAVYSVGLCAANMIPDLINPRLGWTSPTVAMKQNMNAIFGMLLSFMLIGVAIVPAIFLLSSNLGSVGILVLMLAVCGAVSAALVLALDALAMRYNKM